MLKRLFTILILLLAITTFTWLPIALVKAASSTILINAIYYDTYLTGEPDEAVQLINVSAAPITLTNYTLSDFAAVITLTGVISPNQTIWIARQAQDFSLEFGFKPDYEYHADTDASVPDLARDGTFTLANTVRT